MRDALLMSAGPNKTLDLDLELDRFANRSFLEIADHDYVSARLSSRSRLPSQFLWQAQQALEKYFKFILLVHRIKAPKILHDLERALDLLDQQLPFALDLSNDTRDFVKFVNGVGRWRYLEGSIVLKGLELHQLDRAVWEIRRYCQRRLARTQSGPTAAGDRDLCMAELIAAASNRQAFSINGELESIVSDHKHPARKALVWQNLCYGKRRRERLFNVPTPMFIKNAPLWLTPDIVDEVSQYVHIPADAKKAYRELIAVRAKAP
ncbi:MULTISPECIES: HEPN domain-containing protein [unclassified Mesorhizobium]|uniref:HEPN domain-containing protein n=1 Tax=unclassified Mesorhizobium TaxID=325217 RepID=UPI00163D5B3B|nr:MULTISPECIES: HEPN domain-containing protein [unclassified Mesorhizobium]